MISIPLLVRIAQLTASNAPILSTVLHVNLVFICHKTCVILFVVQIISQILVLRVLMIAKVVISKAIAPLATHHYILES